MWEALSKPSKLLIRATCLARGNRHVPRGCSGRQQSGLRRSMPAKEKSFEMQDYRVLPGHVPLRRSTQTIFPKEAAPSAPRFAIGLIPRPFYSKGTFSEGKSPM